MAELRHNDGADPFRQPFRHLALVTLLVALSFLVCEAFHWLDPQHWELKTRPEVHAVFVPHGMLVLLAWVYGWSLIPLVLPSLLAGMAFLVGPQFMTPMAALLAVSHILSVILAFEVLRQVCCDPRGDVGRKALFGLFAAGLVSSIGHNLLRVTHDPCCEVMTGWEKVSAYAVAVGGDLVGMAVVMIGAMLVFRALRQG